MKILIIARYFSPYNAIASVRLTKLAKYLHRNGHHVTVLTAHNRDNLADPILQNDEPEIDVIVRAENSRAYYRLFDCVYGAYKKVAKTPAEPSIPAMQTGGNAGKKSFSAALKEFVRQWMYILENIDFARQAKKELSIKQGEYDVMLSSYGPFSSHLLALHYHRKDPGMKWIADFRDPVELTEEKTLAGRWARRFRRNVYQYANVVTAVSEGTLSSLQVPSQLETCVISNGFDPEDLRFVQATSSQDGIFHMVYPGMIYQGKRNFGSLFRALSELEQECRIAREKVRITYAGPDFYILKAYAAAWNMESVLYDRGRINRQASLALQQSAHVLLLASWNNTGNTGVVTGKFLEYLMARRPILCLISGNEPNSALKELIHEANVGFCCEEAGGEAEFLQMKEYLYQQYCIAVGSGEGVFSPNQAIINRYTYAEKAAAFELLF